MAIAKSTQSANAQMTCEIRVLETAPELIESYRLRHKIYGLLGYLQRDNRAKLEIDEYDMSSISFGAFDPVSEWMIGTLRLVTIDPDPAYGDLVRDVIACFDDLDLTRQAFGQRPNVLPSIVSNEIARQIDAFNSARDAVHELSRTIVHPDYRGSGISRGLMEFGLAYASRTDPAILVGSCLAEHLSLYARYGYMKVPGTSLHRFGSVGKVAHACVCRTDAMPEPTRSHVETLTRAMKAGDPECSWETGPASFIRFRFPDSSSRLTHSPK